MRSLGNVSSREDTKPGCTKVEAITEMSGLHSKEKLQRFLWRVTGSFFFFNIHFTNVFSKCVL